MSKRQKGVLLSIVAISLLFFILFIFPNSKGVKDPNMISVFEVDEFAQYPHVIRMLTPGTTPARTVRSFFAYQHYYYGFPFYFLSAISLIPKHLATGSLEGSQTTMLILRQFVSVLPMLASIAILVFLQTRFNSYLHSIGMFLFLFSIPAVIRNNLWWHPDSLAILFIVLTFFFLDRDNLTFERNFLFAAIACGLAVATKLIGLFFFLTIPVYIIMGLYTGQLARTAALKHAVMFVGIMLAAFLVSSPMLLIPGERIAAINIQQRQAAAMGAGWGLAYPKGPSSWYGIIQEEYGQWYLILLSAIALAVGIVRGPNRNLHILIAAWAIPFGLYILYFIAIKPKHFFLPIALPVFSSLAVLFPAPLSGRPGKKPANPNSNLVYSAFAIIGLGIIGLQFASNVQVGLNRYKEALTKESNHPALNFFADFEKEILPALPQDEIKHVYRDVRVYVPTSKNWNVEIEWDFTDYQYIRENEFDLLFLWNQRILDYTQEGALELAINPGQFEQAHQFYSDALERSIENYQLIFEDEFGAVYVRQDKSPNAANGE